MPVKTVSIRLMYVCRYAVLQYRKLSAGPGKERNIKTLKLRFFAQKGSNTTSKKMKTTLSLRYQSKIESKIN